MNTEITTIGEIRKNTETTNKRGIVSIRVLLYLCIVVSLITITNNSVSGIGKVGTKVQNNTELSSITISLQTFLNNNSLKEYTVNNKVDPTLAVKEMNRYLGQPWQLEVGPEYTNHPVLLIRGVNNVYNLTVDAITNTMILKISNATGYYIITSVEVKYYEA